MDARRVSAPVLGFLGLAAGHFAIGRWRRGLLWLLVGDLLLYLCVTLFLDGALPSVWLVPAILFAFRLASVVDVVRIRRTAAQVPRVGLVALAVVGLFALAIGEQQWLSAKRVEAFKMPSGGMIPALQVGDHFFVDKRPFSPARGDVIVFRYPPQPDKELVKRVIGVGGDTVEVAGGVPMVNGRAVEETELGPGKYEDYDDATGSVAPQKFLRIREALDGRAWEIVRYAGSKQRDFPPVVVPPGHVYVMGDNRDNSHDSRHWGTVPPDHIEGRFLCIYW